MNSAARTQDRLRDRQPERLRGLEIDHKLEFGRLLDGEIGWLRAIEDLVHVGGGAPRSGGAAQRVGEARFCEPLLPQGAAIAEPAGSTVSCWLVARPRE